MRKDTLFGSDAKELLAEGAQKLNNCVEITLGAKGKNVVIKVKGRLPLITKDGATVATHTWDNDRFVQTGIEIVQQASFATLRQAGDGTTTSIILANEMIQRGLEYLKANPTVNTIELKQGMEGAAREVAEYIKSVSEPIKDVETLYKIALVSANGDAEIASIVSQVVYKVGVHGTIEVTAHEGSKIEYELVEGCQVDAGYYHNKFINNYGNKTCELENPLILTSSEPIDSMERLKPFIQFAISNNRSLFVMASVYEGDAYNLLIANSQSSNPKSPIFIGGIKAPDFGDMSLDIMEDIATLTGAKVWSRRMGREHPSVDYFGSAKRVVIHQDKTIIFGGDGDKKEIAKRVKAIRDQIALTDNPEEISNLKVRSARMEGKIGIIKAGSTSDIELQETLARVDDAQRASMSALQEGYVAGAGTTLLSAAAKLDSISVAGAQGIGRALVIEAMKKPKEVIHKNAGIEHHEDLGYPNGTNVMTGAVCNLISEGIIDPAKVCRVSVENSASVAATFLMTECAIIEMDEDGN